MALSKDVGVEQFRSKGIRELKLIKKFQDNSEYMTLAKKLLEVKCAEDWVLLRSEYGSSSVKKVAITICAAGHFNSLIAINKILDLKNAADRLDKLFLR